MKISRVFAALWCASAWLHAVDTKTWQQAEMADFEKGSLTHLSLSSDGRLALAPVLKEVFDPSVTFLWAVARDSKGNLFAGGGGLGGSKAKLVEVDASGKARTLAEMDAMAIQAIAIDREDRVYAATSPDGKVYRVDASGKAEMFYDPQAKYIWALAFSKSGDLFVATGDQGEIHRVTPSGAGSVFFRTEETHARSLAMDANDNLIVGTDPSGLIVRVTPAGQGFVLYQAPKREITAVAVASDGSIYAAGTGIKLATPGFRYRRFQFRTPSPSPAAGPGTTTLTVRRATADSAAECGHFRDSAGVPKCIVFSPTGIRGKSGATRRMWCTRWRSTLMRDCCWGPGITARFIGWIQTIRIRGCWTWRRRRLRGFARLRMGASTR